METDQSLEWQGLLPATKRGGRRSARRKERCLLKSKSQIRNAEGLTLSTILPSSSNSSLFEAIVRVCFLIYCAPTHTKTSAPSEQDCICLTRYGIPSLCDKHVDKDELTLHKHDTMNIDKLTTFPDGDRYFRKCFFVGWMDGRDTIPARRYQDVVLLVQILSLSD
ncbi:Prolow-Density Lipoprotein Receptor-Related Protein 1 [Manis pentadactyla]|nr:Prolow-Density Lipoprotein Receptor-Related Protein 1 [Manis pentadactyla]